MSLVLERDQPMEMTEMVQDEESTLHEGVGILFANQGLKRMCDFLPFPELKRLRLVCRAWKSSISNHRRFWSSKLVLRSGWDKKYLLRKDDLHPKHSVLILHKFILKTSYLFPSYWKEIKFWIKSLFLSNMTISCSDMSKLINDCENLQKVKLNGDVTYEKVFKAWNPLQRHKIYCPHNEFDPGESTFWKNKVGRPTIKSICISGMKSIPICVLDVLEKRCRGKLESFDLNFQDQILTFPVGDSVRYDSHPNITENQPFLEKIFRENSKVLKKLVYYKQGFGHNNRFQNIIGNGNFQDGKLTSFHYVDGWDQREIPRQAFLDFIRTQNQLSELNISFHLSADFRQDLTVLLPTMENLSKITMRILSKEEGLQDLNVFRNMKKLVDLTIIQTKFGQIENHDPLNATHLTGLPPTIRKLTSVFSMRNVWLLAAIVQPSLMLLDKLVIMDGRPVVDTAMQLIISNMKFLKELTIVNAVCLTDTGLIDLPRATCKEMLKSKSSLFLADHSYQNRNCLRKLIHLQKLDLTGCSKLTDVGICLGIRFPELRNLTLYNPQNVSDTSLLSLGIFNPKLEVLNLKRNSLITMDGLNKIIENCKSLQSVRISSMIWKKFKTAQSNLIFKEIVRVIPVYVKTESDWNIWMDSSEINRPDTRILN